ncbi:MAG: hypothetical protein ACD_15C00101G0010 [uncultured bacterium]|nr:MAG: hypothetical protein ACD_15C00101G0010 [uncultured bacterium]HCU70518.1 DNA primase [Candidatus Moranbacteria bacterium]
MSTDLEEIKNRLNIIDVLGEYIRLEKAGANYRANCPFHNEKSPSFMVSEDKQIWHCFGCQKGGDIFGFVMEMEGLEFREALKLLAEKAGVELKKTNPKQAEEKNRTLEILEMATKFYQAHLLQTEAGKKILEYLRERGINDQSIKNFRLGYAPSGWNNASQFLQKKGYTIFEIAKTGLLVEKNNQNDATTSYYDRFRDRIMFPIADTNGKIVGYSARVAPGGDETQAKYVNTPETEVYHKSRILYGMNRAKADIRQQDWILLAEGQMDVIASHQAGLKNTVAVSGTALTQEHLGIIKRYTNNIRMCFDMDSAGEMATKKSIKLCFEKEMSVFVVTIPNGKDAADLAKNNPNALVESVGNAKEAMEYFFENIFSKYNKEKVEDKKKITNELLEMIGYLSNDVEKSHWLKKIASELNISDGILTDMLKKASLRDRVMQTSQNQSHEEKIFAPSEKIETLIKDLIGLMLVYTDVWKEVSEKKDRAYLPKNSLLESMLQQGAEFNFSFDEFINKIDSLEKRSEAEKIYFAARYRVGLDNNLEEIVLDHPLIEARNRLSKIKYEANKSSLDKISKDLDIAKKNNDSMATGFLKEEYSKINSEQSLLNKELNQ